MYAGPLATFLILLLIGIAAAILFDRYVGTSWFRRQVSSSQRRLITSSLVGIAGSFIGYHLFGFSASSSPAAWASSLAPSAQPPCSISGAKCPDQPAGMSS